MKKGEKQFDGFDGFGGFGGFGGYYKNSWGTTERPRRDPTVVAVNQRSFRRIRPIR